MCAALSVLTAWQAGKAVATHSRADSLREVQALQLCILAGSQPVELQAAVGDKEGGMSNCGLRFARQQAA